VGFLSYVRGLLNTWSGKSCSHNINYTDRYISLCGLYCVRCVSSFYQRGPLSGG